MIELDEDTERRRRKRPIHDAAYRATHSEEIKVRNAAYHATHREEIKAYNAAYYAERRDERRDERSAYYAAYRATHREEINANAVANRAAHREEERARRHADLYGLSQAGFLALGDTCQICGARTNGRSLDVDHDHACCPGKKTCGKCVRGVLCHSCNQGLGLFADSATRLREAADYLDKRRQRP